MAAELELGSPSASQRELCLSAGAEEAGMATRNILERLRDRIASARSGRRAARAQAGTVALALPRFSPRARGWSVEAYRGPGRLEVRVAPAEFEERAKHRLRDQDERDDAAGPEARAVPM
jgi:hypothetical protein